MNYSTVNILDLCDEMLLAIFNKLNNIDVLYSFIGVNRKLDRLAQDITFTQSVDLVTILSSEDNDSKTKSIRDRFCFSIIPRIQHNIQCLTLDPLSIDYVLHIGNYPQLHKLTLVNLHLEMASRIFNDGSSFVYIFKHQISNLTVTINDADPSTIQYLRRLSTNVFTTIWIMFTNLTYLHFGLKDICHYPPTFLIDFASTTYYPSNIIHLNVRMRTFHDCLCLLNGHLCQLETFIVEVDLICNASMTINNKKTVSNLKCFSLFSTRHIMEYDKQIVPLLRQMSQLEKLTLFLFVSPRNSFIDGNHLVNDILNKMLHLDTFIFYIISQHTIMKDELVPTPGDVERPLIQRGYNVECYIEYIDNPTFLLGRLQCHIYSLPFTMERMYTFSDKFPGGLFMTVRQLVAYDNGRPFEHDFFVRISQAFPLLNKLKIINDYDQKKKLTHSEDEHEETYSIVEFPHLMILHLSRSSLDYAKQFLFDSNTRLPCLNTLYIKYIDLVIVTENFTNNLARGNCSKLKHFIFESPPNLYPENIYVYFPLLCYK